jgi:hypothetical protein
MPYIQHSSNLKGRLLTLIEDVRSLARTLPEICNFRGKACCPTEMVHSRYTDICLDMHVYYSSSAEVCARRKYSTGRVILGICGGFLFSYSAVKSSCAAIIAMYMIA